MADGKPKVVPLHGGGGNGGSGAVAGVEIPDPPPGHNLDRQGRRLYDWICTALIKDGRKVGAAGIQIVLLVHTFLAWSDDMKACIKDGRYAESKDGNKYELPHSYNERKARDEIKRELPEACLTVMSQIEARLKESKTGGAVQDDLFADLVEFASARPSVNG
ncbi:MAG: hypothetical protein PHD19_09450 [Dechloromonas sp.]|nr:hypothetical protein [Dechloromonas sp.]